MWQVVAAAVQPFGGMSFPGAASHELAVKRDEHISMFRCARAIMARMDEHVGVFNPAAQPVLYVGNDAH